MSDVDIWIYPGETIEEDIVLFDPTQAREEEEEEIFVRNGVSIGPYLIV